MDLLVLKGGAWQPSVRISVPIQDFLRHFVLVVVLDDFKVKFAPDQLHIDLQFFFKDLLLQVHSHRLCQLIRYRIVVPANQMLMVLLLIVLDLGVVQAANALVLLLLLGLHTHALLRLLHQFCLLLVHFDPARSLFFEQLDLDLLVERLVGI